MISKFRKDIRWEQAAVGFLFLAGILLRLRQYLTGRSLWADEAMLALNITNRNVMELFQPLDYDQGAPIGFLLVEKILSLSLGRNEYVLRLFPFLAGILSLWLFYLLLQRTTAGAGLVTALALFAFNPRLVYYSSEVKQYIIDVTVCIVLLLVAAPLFESAGRKRYFVRLAAAGSIALWFSHPSLFVLAGIGLTLVILYLQKGESARLGLTVAAGMVWLATIGFLYFLVLYDLRQNAYMQEYWQGGFFPFPPWGEPGWFDRSLRENIGLQFGIPYAVIPVFGLVLAGWVALWISRRVYAAALGTIMAVTLTASALSLYPVFERMILFLIPVGILMLGKAVEALADRLQSFGWAGGFTTSVVAFFLIYGPFTTSISSLFQPKYFEHIRPAMQFLEDTWRPGDTLFVTHGAVPAFEYYAPLYGMERIPYLTSQRQDYLDSGGILQQLDRLQGQRRAWVLMSHVYEQGNFNEQEFILEHLKQNGTRQREFRQPGTSVYLYLFDLAD